MPIRRFASAGRLPFPYTLENEYLPLAPRILQGIEDTSAFVA